MVGRTKNAVRNIFLGTVSNIVSILFPSLTRRVLIYVGIQYVGLGRLFMVF